MPRASLLPLAVLLAAAACPPQSAATLTLSADEPAGPNCPYGGKSLKAGTDKNGNGTLDGDEIVSVSYACSNAPGGGGGAGCGPANCSGCCDGSGTCRLENDGSACGLFGVSCAVCGASQACSDHGVCFDPVPDAGAPARCSRANCSGCCDANGVCQLGNSVDACGVDAQSCSACASGQLCSSSGACTSTGTGGGTGGQACGPSNCSGCCLNGQCVSGVQPTACGKQGQVCAGCAAGQACTQGVCQAPSSCPGCTDSTGACQPGSQANACGVGGVLCAACAGGQSCVNGACMFVGCNSATCPSGCCAGTTCVTQLSNVQCGLGGAACVSCSSGTVCSTASGTCVITGGTCGPSTCTGCCVNGQCVSGAQATACGKQGQVCVICPSGQQCSQGVCESPITCTGCKDLLGICQPGTSISACGTGGSACMSCTSGQSCTSGTCTGGACNSATCPNGCCTGNTCVTNLTASQCGLGGASCVACVNGGSCNVSTGTCSGGTGGGTGGGVGGGLGGGPGSCVGCTDSAGACVTTLNDSTCLADSSAALGAMIGSPSPCVACPSGTTCMPNSLGIPSYCQ